MLMPWSLHPRATRETALVPSNLTPWMPSIGNQDRIGACNSYGTKDGVSTSMSKAGHPVPGYLAALPLYRGTRCLERAASTWSGDELPPLTDCGADPDDVLRVAQQFGIQTSAQECHCDGPCSALSKYEDDNVNAEPTLGEFEHDSTFKVVGGFDIVSSGQQRLLDVSNALASGYAVGISLYAADDRYQQYDGGILADPPSGSDCDHYNYLVGLDLASGSPLFIGVNSWDVGWGVKWGSAPGGCWIGGPAIIQASDRLVVYSVQEATT
jgi:hypothetical protein